MSIRVQVQFTDEEWAELLAGFRARLAGASMPQAAMVRSLALTAAREALEWRARTGQDATEAVGPTQASSRPENARPGAGDSGNGGGARRGRRQEG